MTPTPDDESPSPWAGMIGRPQPQAKTKTTRLSRERLLQVICELHAAGRVVTRTVVIEITGQSYSVVDDHLKRLIEDGGVRRVAPGVYEPIDSMPTSRAISVTRMPGGWVKIEAGDDMLTLTPEEERMLAASIAGAAGQFHALAAGRDLADQIAELRQQHSRVKDELRARPPQEPHVPIKGARDLSVVQGNG